MPARIREYCAATGQPQPADPAAVTRCILESLALKHAETVDLLASVAGAAPAELHMVGGGARNEPLCRWTASAAELPVLAGPEEATLLGNLLVQAIALGELGSLAEAREVVRASFAPRVHEPEPSSRWREARARFAALGARGGASHERGARRPARHPRARGPLGRGAGRRPRRARVARVPLEPARLRPRARKHRRREHVSEGDGRRPRGSGDARAVGQGVRDGSGDDHAGRLRRAPARRGAAAARRASRWTTRRWSTTSSAARSGPTSRGRRSRRCCTRSWPRRRSTTRTRTRSSRSPRRPTARRLAEDEFGDEAVWLDYQRPGFDMSRRIAELLDEHPSARAVLLAKHGLVTWGETRRGELPRDDRVRLARRARDRPRGRAAGSGSAARAVPEADDDEAARLLVAGSAGAPRRAARGRARRDPRGRPEPRGGRVRARPSARPR